MAYSKLGIANLALGKIGAKSIVTLGEATNEYEAFYNAWEYIRDEVLEAKVWHFAHFRERLIRLNVTPAFGFDYAYALPTGFLKFMRFVPGRPSIYPNTLDPTAFPHVVQSIMVPYGLDKITNGTFATDSDWTKGTGWTIASGKATKAVGAVATLSQDVGTISLVADETYLLTFDVESLSGGNITPSIGGAVGMPIGSSGDAVSQYITALNATDGLVFTPSASGVICNLDNVTMFKCTELLALFTDYEDSDEYPLYADILRRVIDVTRYSPSFISALAFRLAAEMSLKLTEGMSKYQAMMSLYGKALTDAEAVAQSLDHVEDETGSTAWVDAGR